MNPVSVKNIKMETPQEKTEEKVNEIGLLKNRVHSLLAHSYVFYFFGFIFGISLDIVSPIDAFGKFSAGIYVGVLMIFAGTLLIFWAQKVSLDLKKDVISKKTFSKGPYRFTANPTNWGVFFLMIGFGIMANAIFVVLCTLFCFCLSQTLFLRRQNSILVKKYGEHFLKYKKSIKF